MAAITKTRIERLSRALLPRHGLQNVGDLVATIVKYRNRDGYASIGRPEGGWSWFAARGATAVTPSRVTLAFPSDPWRRDAARAREDLHRQLENASFSVMSEDEIELAMRSGRAPAAAIPDPSPPSSQRAPAAQLRREISEALTTTKNLGAARADRLASALRGLGHEAQAFRQYDQWNSVGVHRVGRGTAGDWRQIVTFLDDGGLQPPAGGPAYGTGNPWRHGPEHDAVEEVMGWRG